VTNYRAGEPEKKCTFSVIPNGMTVPLCSLCSGNNVRREFPGSENDIIFNEICQNRDLRDNQIPLIIIGINGS